MKRKIVVIGGVAGGAGAATKARRVDEAAEIIMFERGAHVSFANCGLPYHIGGQIEERDNLFLVSPDRFKNWYNIDAKINHEVIKIDRANRKVQVMNHTNGETFWESYDKLIVATGGSSLKPPIPGIDLENIHNLWTVQDMDNILEGMANTNLKKVAVIGAGFVGLEIVEAFVNKGLEVVLVEKDKQVLPAIDHEMTKKIQTELENKNVHLILGQGVTEFEGKNGKVEKIILEQGTSIEVDLVVVSIGVKPNLCILEDADIEIGYAGGVVVNEYMQTNDPHIYAAGDIVESTHLVTGKKMRMPLAGPANKQGRVAGANVAGGKLKFKGALGTFIVKIFDIVAAKTGLSEKEIAKEKIEYFLSYSATKSHSGYYPGAEWMIIKLLAEKRTGRILGAQVVGAKGVDKRIDVLATAIYAKLTVEDLENLDLAYAPPFSSAKDPVIIAGMVASNLMRGEIETININEFNEALGKGEKLQVVDCRSMSDIDDMGRIPDSEIMPVDEIREWFGDLDKDAPTVLYCGIGYRSYLAYKILKHHGFNVKNLSGGYSVWAGKTPK
ncbi:MAG: pyridine nucleotide-disulfide oxidoreductase [Desulfitibacter sp. BRH_c19]|nr:MAG: pyridine nucleotide-disulfide oxidoreductase [Desulfitibacter sp. BRH_c19]